MRLFVALRPPPPVRALLAGLMRGIDGARWQDDEQLHLTLRFVGEADARTADELVACLGHALAPAPVARLAGVGMFDRRGRADALWAGVAPAEPLAAFHRKVDRACQRAGVAAEGRAYRPHVTVARLGRGIDPAAASAWMLRHQGLTSEPFAMDRMLLYRSHLSHDGAGYEVVESWRLRPE